MSFGKSKTNSNQNSTGQDTTSGTTNFTQTPTNPDWVSTAAQGLLANGQTLAGADPTSYVAGPNSLLTQAGANATNLSGTPWAYDAAQDVNGGVANAKTPSIAGDISQFMSPYTDSVVNSTLADFDHQAGLTKAQDDLNLAASGAFGGSGAALTKAATADNLARARATTEAGLRQAGFSTALGGATSQAQLQQQQEQQRLQAAAQIAQTANDYGANSRANVAAQDAAAQPLQAIDQAKATAPLDLNSWLASIFAGSQPGLFQGQTGTQVQNGTESQVTSGKGGSTTFGFKNK